MTTKAILFDCFGVLYPDTFWTMADEFLGSRVEEHRAGLRDLIRQVDMGYITREQLWEKFAEIVGHSIDDVYERLEQFGGLDNRLLQFIDEHKSDYKIGMISNVGAGFIERMFIERPVTEYFDVVILSSEVGLVKPDVRIYNLAAEKLGLKPAECVFIDDIKTNAEGAEKAGMGAITYTSFAKFIEDIKQFV